MIIMTIVIYYIYNNIPYLAGAGGGCRPLNPPEMSPGAAAAPQDRNFESNLVGHDNTTTNETRNQSHAAANISNK